ncbi:hypothetical protein QMS56_09640 [Cronobacter malonaticus]|uniref:hypothetical protein n=1 Tax=Cronobacter malonaticus TaxID=413503 RepID=UPI0024C46AA8|nr:hypothetical protein [Cronobacter malonaticus]MDK1256885.1 hypothetical protein [Cronobacter malonaticus]MDK1321604.1 hypothetical protein [Cronobacter malonaticus]
MMQEWFVAFELERNGTRTSGWNIFTDSSGRSAKEIAAQYVIEAAKSLGVPVENIMLTAFNRV